VAREVQLAPAFVDTSTIPLEGLLILSPALKECLKVKVDTVYPVVFITGDVRVVETADAPILLLLPTVEAIIFPVPFVNVSTLFTLTPLTSDWNICPRSPDDVPAAVNIEPLLKFSLISVTAANEPVPANALVAPIHIVEVTGVADTPVGRAFTVIVPVRVLFTHGPEVTNV